MKRLAFCLALLFVAPVSAQDKPVQRATGYKPLPAAQRAALHAAAFKKHGYTMRELVKAITPPAEFDAKDMGWTVDPGDQGNCGSCYLYSTVKTMSNAAIKAGLGKASTFRLSTQYGMDCHDFGGCNGGNGTEVIQWALQNGWVAEADPNQPAGNLYGPYQARSMSCRLPAGAKKFTPKSWMFITSDQGDHPATVDEYKAALLAFGTINIAIDAGGQFGNYNGGVITSMGNSIDHEVQIRGWSDSKQAVLCENQWAGYGGAKAPGDNCCWISYKALPAIVDPFVVLFESPAPPAKLVVNGPATVQASTTTIYTATGATGAVTWTATAGTIASTGQYTAPPAPANVTITATDSIGASGSLAVTVVATPIPPIPPTPPGGPVNINLTPEQVASVMQQAGGIIITETTTIKDLLTILQPDTVKITGDMTLNDLLALLAQTKAKAKSPCDKPPAKLPQPNSVPPPLADDKWKKQEETNAEIIRALKAISRKLLETEK